MKLLTLCLLSSLASAAPQHAEESVEAELADVLQQYALAAQKSAEASSTLEVERLGLRAAQNALASARRAQDESRILIGITGGLPGATLCAHLGLNADQTIVVNSVGPDMSAERAGLQVHDLIVEIEGQPVATMDHLRQTLDRMNVGDVLNLTIVSRGQRRSLSIPILEAQQWRSDRAPSSGFFVPDAGEGTRDIYFRDTLRELADSQRQAVQVEAELARVQAESARSAAQIESVRELYHQALSKLEGAQGEGQPAQDLGRARLDVARRYEQLLEEEEKRLIDLRDMQSRREELRAHAAARSSELLAREGARFVDQGERSSLFMPDRMRDPRIAAPQSADRLGKVEQRVDELHARFDRLEEMLERIAAHKDN